MGGIQGEILRDTGNILQKENEVDHEKTKKYCQLISNKTKVIRMHSIWCLDNLISGETFQNVIFVDETNVELNNASRLSFYKTGPSFDRIPARCANSKYAYTVRFVLK